MSARPHIFRLRVLLKTHRAVALHPHHAGLLYAVVSEANGLALNAEAALPDGVMVEAVEQLRCRVNAFETYAFGITLLATSVEDAHTRVRLLRQGLVELSRKPPSRRGGFCGNFSLKSITDLVNDRPLFEDHPPTPIAEEDIVAEVTRLRDTPRITLRFTTPLRMSRSKHHREGERHSFFDRRSFVADVFVRRVRGRLEKLGFVEPRDQNPLASGVRVGENHLVWADVAYGGHQNHTKLGGAMGDVVLENLTPDDIETLVRGQYIGVGENTRFGHGHYRIAQLGSDPHACPRSTGLCAVAFSPRTQRVNFSTQRVSAESVQRRIATMQAGHRTAAPFWELTVRRVDHIDTRTIPSPEDRFLQQAVLQELLPALERLFPAPRDRNAWGPTPLGFVPTLAAAEAAGYAWGWPVECTPFFETIAHAELEHRWRAAIADDELVSMLMAWVEQTTGAPRAGFPIGSSLAALAAPLFLDELATWATAQSAGLVRHRGQWLILSRDRAAAEQADADARRAAEQLRRLLDASATWPPHTATHLLGVATSSGMKTAGRSGRCTVPPRSPPGRVRPRNINRIFHRERTPTVSEPWVSSPPPSRRATTRAEATSEHGGSKNGRRAVARMKAVRGRPSVDADAVETRLRSRLEKTGWSRSVRLDNSDKNWHVDDNSKAEHELRRKNREGQTPGPFRR